MAHPIKMKRGRHLARGDAREYAGWSASGLWDLGQNSPKEIAPCRRRQGTSGVGHTVEIQGYLTYKKTHPPRTLP